MGKLRYLCLGIFMFGNIYVLANANMMCEIIEFASLQIEKAPRAA